MKNRISLLSNYFSRDLPKSNAPRSLFPFKQPVRQGYMVGGFYPIGKPIFVNPNDGLYNIRIDGVLRTGSALVFPPLDDAYVDIVAVWVPMRIIWNHYFQFLGANDVSAWTQQNTYNMPTKTLNNYAQDAFSAAFMSNFMLESHFGLPYANNGQYINVLFHRAYYCAWNHLIRDPNWLRPVLYSVGDTGSAGEFGYDDLIQAEHVYDNLGQDQGTIGGDFNVGTFGTYERPLIMPSCRFHNWNTTMLPEPQAGDPSTLAFAGDAPISQDTTKELLQFTNASGSTLAANSSLNVKLNTYNAVATGSTVPGDLVGFLNNTDYQINLNPKALQADLSQVTAFNINQLRQTVLMQIFKEKLARSGQRVNDIISVFFGVQNPGVNDDLPELLCHKRFRVGVNQVVSTSDSTNTLGATSHLGDVGAMSITTIQDELFSKSFTEHGFIVLGLMIRTADSSASQGIHPDFLMTDKFDMFWPVFDHIGETPIKAEYINAQSDAGLILGYQEAWWFRRTQVAVNGGIMDPSIPGSYNFASYARVFDKFTANNGIGPGFFIQTPDEFDRVLLANHAVQPQFLGDLLIHGTFAATMSAHSTPMLFGERI